MKLTIIILLMIIGPLCGPNRTAYKLQCKAQEAVYSALFTRGEPATYPENRGTADETEHIFYDWLWEPLRINWPLIAVGLGGIWAALRTLNIIKRQTAATEEAAQASKTSADAALLNSRILVNIDRALIEIELGQADSHRGKWGMEEPGYSKEETFRFGVRITNHGRTVARIVSHKLWHGLFETNFDRDKFNTFTESMNHLLLDAGNSITLFNIDADELFSHWVGIGSTEKVGMMRIDVRYADVIEQKDGGHETSVIYLFQGSLEEPQRLAQFNVYK
jgi:hypothetical protein